MPEVRLTSVPSEADGHVLFDVSNLAWRSAFGNQSLKSADGRPSGHVYGSLSSILALMRADLEPGCWLPVWCMDGPGAGDARRAVAPLYKADRDPNRINPCPEVEQAIGALPGIQVKQRGREGDDAIAWWLTRGAPAMGLAVARSVIYSGDEDQWSLVTDTIKVYSPNFKHYVTDADALKKWAAPLGPKIRLAKALFGDSDNVGGVPRLQKKLVAPIIARPEVVDPETFYAAVPDSGLKGKTLESVHKHRDRVELGFKVILPWLDGFGAASLRFGASDRGAVERMMGSWTIKHLLPQAGVLAGLDPIHVPKRALVRCADGVERVVAVAE